MVENINKNIAIDSDGKELRVGDIVKRIDDIDGFVGFINARHKLNIKKSSMCLITKIKNEETIAISFKGKEIDTVWDAYRFKKVCVKKIKFDEYKKCEQYV